MVILNTGDLALTPSTVNSDIFARILFSQIAFKDIFEALEIRDLGMIYVRISVSISVNDRVILPFREGFNFTILLLWIICVTYVLCLSCFRVCSLLP